MPLTNAEKRKRYIENLKKHGNYEDYKKKKAEHEKERRRRQKNHLMKLTEVKRNQKLSENRLKCRKRVEECRNRKKESESKKNNGSIGYRTEGALKKAVTKVRKALPTLPEKRNDVVGKLLHSFDEITREKIIRKSSATKNHERKGIGLDVIVAVEKFYERDDISRISPNVKDCRKFTDRLTGQKQLKQIRHLMFTLKECYALFIDDFCKQTPAVPLKLSKFCSLRPEHVKLVNKTPHIVCGCFYHSNFIECCTVLNKNLNGFPEYGPELINLLVCEESDKNCWFKNCKRCSPEEIVKKLMDISKDEKSMMKRVNWIQWEKVEEEKRFKQSEKKGTVKDVLEWFKAIYVKFLKHSFIKREQAEYFNIDRGNVDVGDDNECLLQIDFAENFTCEAQQEIQNAHWNQKQISLFTVALHHSNKLHSKVVVSDNTDHSKTTFVPYLYAVLSRMPKIIKVVKIWSDGPSSQFKNKFVAAVIKFFEDLFSIKIFWNYFPTSHGKGCVDGIGAVAKRTVRTMVTSRRSIVTCAKDFVKAFNEGKSTIEVFEMNNSDIDKIHSKLKLNDLFQSAPTIKAISSFHQLQFLNDKVVGFTTSKDGYEIQKK